MQRPGILLPLLSALVLWASASPAATRPAITGIAFVRVYASDPAASAAFYGQTLGFDRAPTLATDGIARYGVNEAQWIEVAPLPANPPATRLPEVAFTTRDAAALQRYLRAHKVKIVSKLKDGVFTVNDPEGNLIGFVQREAEKGKLPLSARETSHRIIHAGYIVHDRAAEDAFYRDLLGFHLYWQGGMVEGRTDWVSMQVPEGTDWIEYMLDSGPTPSAKQLGVLNHFSLGVAKMDDAIVALNRNGCTGAECSKTQMGRDGKVQLNLFDPDLTRVEYMHFQPSGTICCTPILGKPPGEVEDQ